MTAAILDVFHDRATPQLRKARPALFRARVKWAERKIALDRLGGLENPRTVAGVSVGDRVSVEVLAGIWWRGTLIQWVRAGQEDGRAGSLVGHIRLDPWPPGTLPQNFDHIVARHHRRFRPLQETA